MAGTRLATIIIYTVLAFLLLLFISRTPTKPSSHAHRRLKLRSNFTFVKPNPHDHDPIPFDPLVAQIERRREDREWEKQRFEFNDTVAAVAVAAEGQPEWEDFTDAEDFLNDQDKFNVSGRLLLLFPKIDVNPADGFVSVDELTDWNLHQAEMEVMHRTQRELEVHDKNKDGLVAFSEYDPPSWVKASDSNSPYDMGWWKEEHFNASDADGDGLLNITEFNDFLHPADSKNPKLLEWLCKEEIRERDTDKDGKINFKEFFHGLFDLVRDYEDHGHEHHSDDSAETPARQLLAQLDQDGDGLLSDTELLPIIGKLHPSERYYAKQQADYIITQADTDKDGRLSLTEMLDNPYVFYSAIFNDDDNEEYYHDEFR
ncbi:unnamed protein product [Rhodiola kirilowii]